MNASARSPLRPRPARWFEMLVARDDTTLALEALAATGAVELEARDGASLPPAFADLRPLLPQFAELAARYRAFWPRMRLEASALPEPPVSALQRSLSVLRAWARDAEPLVRRLQAAEAEAARLQHWRAVFAQLQAQRSTLDLAQAAQAGPTLQVRLAVFPPGSAPQLAGLAHTLLAHAFESDVEPAGTQCLLTLGTPEQQHALASQVLAAKGQWLEPPQWLSADAAACDEACAARQRALADEAAGARRALDAAAHAHGLHRALADVHRLQWVLDNVHGLESGPLLCWITGWTSRDAAALEAAVDASGARALLRLAAPPAGARAPMLLANPWWARPFEVFARAMGMPSGTEADPSTLLAVAVPLMFGYMFGDVGQGLVIAAVGFALRRRFPLARLFIAGGVSAALFGLLFGSVFSLHLLHPLWLAPLDDPLAVLTVPLAGGAALLALGLLLSALEAHWRGELGAWLATDLGFVIAYLGLVAAPFGPWAGASLALAAAGALLCCAGHAWQARRASAALVALGELAERLLQILINTLSFARVGAFALAHAGLSSAIVALMGAATSTATQALVLVLGNLVVMALEGLVVSIQTTRLVLFEFFARFLEAQGRVFRPLPPPPSMTPQESST
ncbi:MAG TPA: hypothetical protein VFQ16_04050 [Burkholderiaceae bacterium]|nr:hypothetical protein [Burkholderiaceae bacterium]